MLKNILTGLLILFLFAVIIVIVTTLCSLLPSGWVTLGFVVVFVLIISAAIGEVYNTWDDTEF